MRRAGIIFVYQEPRFTPPQLRTMADISVAFGQLMFAFAVLPFVIPALDKDKLLVIFLRLSSGITCWIIGLFMSRNAT